MFRKIIKSSLAVTTLISLNANAWVISNDATIEEIIQWHGNQEVYFKTSAGNICYIPSNEDKFYSLILSMWASGRKGDFHCFDETHTTQAVVGHRLHRIIAR